MELTDVYVRKVDEQVVVYVLQMVTAAATAAIDQWVTADPIMA
jgi:hypothetical protein